VPRAASHMMGSERCAARFLPQEASRARTVQPLRDIGEMSGPGACGWRRTGVRSPGMGDGLPSSRLGDHRAAHATQSDIQENCERCTSLICRAVENMRRPCNGIDLAGFRCNSLDREQVREPRRACTSIRDVRPAPSVPSAAEPADRPCFLPLTISQSAATTMPLLP
jgi:hypothetical protein